MKNNNWQIKYLKDLCTQSGEYGLNAPAIAFTKEFPLYLRITDITDDGIYSDKQRVSVAYTGTEKLLNNNDFLFARTGATVGKTYLNRQTDEKIAFAGYLIRFVPDLNKILPYYLVLYCQTKPYWKWVKIFSIRSGQPGISAEEYGKLPIPCPPMEEQRRIVEVLECWDKGIELVKKLIEQKELQKKYLMQQLLSGNRRLKGFTDKWIIKKLENLLIQINERNRGENCYPILSVTNTRGIVRADEHFSKRVAGKDLSNYKIVHKGNFAYNPSRINVGSIALLDAYIAGLLSPMYVVFECSQEIDLLYFKFFIQDTTFLTKVANSAQGSVRSTVDFEILSSIKIKFPSSKREQQAIAEVLSSADKEIDLLKQKLAKLEAQKKGLMQVLLTGKIRLK